jgi:hypothetical protein
MGGMISSGNVNDVDELSLGIADMISPSLVRSCLNRLTDCAFGGGFPCAVFRDGRGILNDCRKCLPNL